MLNGLHRATHVLCVCSETYYRRFRGLEVPGKGKGADWEGALISQALYDARSQSNKFVPVLFAAADESYIPEPLRPQTHYLLDCAANYKALYDALLGQAGVEAGQIGDLKPNERPRAQQLRFDATPTPNTTPANVSPALTIWREKLVLLVEEAVCVEPGDEVPPETPDH